MKAGFAASPRRTGGATAMTDTGNIGLLGGFIGGLIMILMGIAMISGKLTLFAVWMLKLFPVTGTLG